MERRWEDGPDHTGTIRTELKEKENPKNIHEWEEGSRCL
jgi:hypothetical protein